MPTTHHSPSITSHRCLRRFYRSGLLLLLALVSAEAIAATPIKVFLLGGQSNMRGRASTSGLPQSLLDPQGDILV
ncbi:MAG TPA: hypothetical protein VJ952_07060 [Opitutales bacterium]|nr:hypothetical protein [Opitutales bacterium]